MPRVTVLVPVYNRPQVVREALDSALAQECPGGFEVLVVDDGSTDATPDVLAAYGDRIRVIRQDNAGPSVARNTGIAAAQGEYVAFLDSDDVWLPGKLALQVRLLDEHPDAAFVHTEVAEFHEETGAKEWTRRPPVLSGDVLRALLRRNFVHTMTVMARRSALDEAGGFDPEYPPCEDWDLWLRITARHPVVGDATPTVRTRIHAGSISADPIVVYTQAGKLLAAAAERLAAEGSPHAGYARRQAARYEVKLGRRLARAGRHEEADAAFRRSVALHPWSRLEVLRARLFPKR